MAQGQRSDYGPNMIPHVYHWLSRANDKPMKYSPVWSLSWHLVERSGWGWRSISRLPLGSCWACQPACWKQEEEEEGERERGRERGKHSLRGFISQTEVWDNPKVNAKRIEHTSLDCYNSLLELSRRVAVNSDTGRVLGCTLGDQTK